ncbi:nucleoside triphosphate pyrophosphohydrolase family protein [Vibrio sp.]|nr:nucleoside triphosphate pyrophosphohydrolase family protein [Vibrio sp.]
MEYSQLTQTFFTKLYQDIEEFRFTFDLPVTAPKTLDSSADTLHSSLIIEEMTELAEADSKIEQADAIVDSVYVLMGRLVHLGSKDINDTPTISYFIDVLLNVAINRGIHFEPCWDEVHSSNMSKVCRTDQEFKDTETHYAKEGITLEKVIKGDYIIAKCAEDFVSPNKTIRKGKVLKSVYYRPAALETLVADR